MTATDWATVTALGAFAVGAAAGAIATIRLAKILAQFFIDQLRDRHEPPDPDP